MILDIVPYSLLVGSHVGGSPLENPVGLHSDLSNDRETGIGVDFTIPAVKTNVKIAPGVFQIELERIFVVIASFLTEINQPSHHVADYGAFLY